MDEDYFKNIRTVGVTLDQGIVNLQEAWKIPNLMLCKNNEEDQIAAKKLVDNLRNELSLLKGTIEEKKVEISSLRETHAQFLEESTKAIKSLKEEVDEIKVLFLENGYVEDPAEPDLSLLTNQLESLSFNSGVSLVKDVGSPGESPMCENDSVYDSPMQSDGTPNSGSFGSSVTKRTLMDERPMEPVYSPYYYKMMKK